MARLLPGADQRYHPGRRPLALDGEAGQVHSAVINRSHARAWQQLRARLAGA